MTYKNQLNQLLNVGLVIWNTFCIKIILLAILPMNTALFCLSVPHMEIYKLHTGQGISSSFKIQTFAAFKFSFKSN